MAPPKGFNKGVRPPAAGMGRKRGSQNKITRALKDLILGALAEVGGQRIWSSRRGRTPRRFWRWSGRCCRSRSRPMVQTR
jgi:hypothetical protein